MQKYAVGVLALALAGCGATVESMVAPDGRQGYVLSCDGSGGSWSACYQAAAQACAGRYEILDRQQTGTATPYGPLINRNMVISCRG